MGFTEEFLLTGKGYADFSPQVRNLIKIEGHQRLQVEEIKILRSSFERQSRQQQDVLLHERRKMEGLAREVEYSNERMADRIVEAVQEQGEAACEKLQMVCDVLGWGFSEVSWRLEEQTKVGRQILDVLLNSLDVTSRQFMQQGIKSFDVDEYEIAKKCFRKALRNNETAFLAYQYLGRIAVLQSSAEEALRNFDLASKFAEEPQPKALALSHAARCHLLLGDTAQGIEKAKLAAELQPELASYHFDLAIQLAAERRASDATAALGKAIQIERLYWARAAVEDGLNPIRDQVDAFLAELQNAARQAAVNALSELACAIDRAEKFGCGAVAEPCKQHHETLHCSLAADSYSRFLDISSEAKQTADDLRQAVGKHLETKIAQTQAQILSKTQQKDLELRGIRAIQDEQLRPIENEIRDCERRIRQLSETWKKRELWRWGGKVTGASAMGCGTVFIASLIVFSLILATKQPLLCSLASLMCLVVWVKAPSIAEYFRYLNSVKRPENELLRSTAELRTRMDSTRTVASEQVATKSAQAEEHYRPQFESLEREKEALETSTRAWNEGREFPGSSAVRIARM